MLDIVNKFAKQNKDQWKKIQGIESKKLLGKQQDAQQGVRQSTMDHIIESESEEESRSKNDDNLGLIAADDASLTLEDQQDI